MECNDGIALLSASILAKKILLTILIQYFNKLKRQYVGHYDMTCELRK